MKKLKKTLFCMLCIGVICGTTACGTNRNTGNNAANNTNDSMTNDRNTKNNAMTNDRNTQNDTVRDNRDTTVRDNTVRDNTVRENQNHGGVINDLGNAVEDGVKDVERGVDNLTGNTTNNRK